MAELSLYEKIMCRHWSTSVLTERTGDPVPVRRFLDWQHRQFAFQFKSKRRETEGYIYNMQLLDHVQAEVRVLRIAKAPSHAYVSDLFEHDVLIGWGGFDRYYDELIRRHGQPWSEFPATGHRRGARGMFWFDYAAGHSILLPDSRLKNLHYAGPIDFKEGDRIKLDGVSCSVFAIVGPDDAEEFDAARSFNAATNCMCFWPSSHNLEALCDNAKMLELEQAQELVRAVDPRAYIQEENARIRHQIRLEHKARNDGLLANSSMAA